MSRSPNKIKKYSVRSMAAGTAFCPSCSRLTDWNVEICPTCGFMGEHTMEKFPISAPPLQLISDHAGLFKPTEQEKIQKAIQSFQREFPQFHWRIVTATLQEENALSLFAFWLFNVSPESTEDEAVKRRWTVMIVILANGDVAVVPGYSAEMWLSGNDWDILLASFQSAISNREHVAAFRGLFSGVTSCLRRSWKLASGRLKKRNKRKVVKEH